MALACVAVYFDMRIVPLNARDAAKKSVDTTTRSNLMAASGSLWSAIMLGLCIYVFQIVTGRIQIAAFALSIAFLGLISQRERFRFPPFLWIFVLWVAWAFIASFFSDYPEVARAAVIERLKVGAIILLAVNALRNEKQLQAFLILLLVSFLVYPVRGTLLNYSRGITLAGRAAWNYIYSNPNDLAAASLIVFGAALAVAFAKAVPTWYRRLCAIGGILVFTVILLTQSRGAFIGLVVGFGPVAVMTALRGVRLSRLLLAVVATAVVAYSIPSSVWLRLQGISKLGSVATIAQADIEGSAAERYEIQKVALRIFQDHPLMGVGLNAYRYANARYAPKLGLRDAHDTYLDLAAELGLPGLLIWCSMVASVLLQARKLRKAQPQVDAGIQQVWIERSLIAFLVAGFFGSYSSLSMPHVMLAVLWCLMMRRAEGVSSPTERVSARMR